MKINFLGDSITQGAGASSIELSYVSLVGQMLGCEVCNFGIGGTRIARQTVPTDASFDEDYIIRAEKMGDADFVFVFGGTNDYGHGDAPFGEPSDSTVYTFYGAFNNLADYLLERYGREKLCYILPLQRYNQSNIYGDGIKTKPCPPLVDYIEAERAMLEKRGIEYLDLTELFPEPDTKEPSELFIDGLHPNDKGHKMLAECVCSWVKNKS